MLQLDFARLAFSFSRELPNTILPQRREGEALQIQIDVGLGNDIGGSELPQALKTKAT